MKKPDFLKRLQSLGYDPVWSPPAEFEAFVKNELEAWAKSIATAKIQPQ